MLDKSPKNIEIKGNKTPYVVDKQQAMIIIILSVLSAKWNKSINEDGLFVSVSFVSFKGRLSSISYQRSIILCSFSIDYQFNLVNLILVYLNYFLLT